MADVPRFTDAQRGRLLYLARAAITSRFETDVEIPTCTDAAFEEKRGAFVTLTIGGQLRGCIGRIEAVGPLWDVVADMAVAAAFQDPRFGPLTRDELDRIQIEISVLTPMVPVEGPDDIVVGTHGLLIRKGPFSGLLLPQVASSRGWDVRTFLQETCRKAGLKPDDWQQEDAEILMFSAEVFGDEDTEP